MNRPLDDPTLRHRVVPVRVLGDELIVARPRDGTPMIMEPTAALVWRLLDDGISPDDIDRRLADAFPEVPGADRLTARQEILAMLRDDDLLEPE